MVASNEWHWVYTRWIDVPKTWLKLQGQFPIHGYLFIKEHPLDTLKWLNFMTKKILSPSSSLLKICSWSGNDNSQELKAAIPKSESRTALSSCAVISRVLKHAEEINGSIIGLSCELPLATRGAHDTIFLFFSKNYSPQLAIRFRKIRLSKSKFKLMNLYER